MPKRLPDYCVEDRDRHGNVRVYFRRAGQKKIRLRDVPWSEPFMEAYRLALRGQSAPLLADGPALRPTRKPAQPGTWRWLCQLYFTSIAFKELDRGTQLVRRRILETTFDEPTKPGAETVFADFPLARMNTSHIEVLRDRRADKLQAANARVKAIRRVFAFGLSARHVTSNPARDVETFSRKTAGFYAWTIADVLRYTARHPIGTKAYLALALLLYVGGGGRTSPRWAGSTSVTAGCNTPNIRTATGTQSR
jgi:hypothetical protein